MLALTKEANMLESFDKVELDPPSGVYVFMQGDEVVYVGSSENVWYRIGLHRNASLKGKGDSGTECKVYDRMLVKVCDIDEAIELEIAIYYKYQPKYNKAIPRSYRPRRGEPKVDLLKMLDFSPIKPIFVRRF